MEVAEEEVPTPAKLRKLRVVDLRKRLHSFRLPQSGNKEELIGRLHQFYVDQRAKMESEKEKDGEGEVGEGVPGEKGDSGESESVKEGGEEKEGDGVEEMETGVPEQVVDGGEPVPSEQPVQDAHEQEPTGNDIIPAGNDITPGDIPTDGATLSVSSSEKTEGQGVTEGEGGGSHAGQQEGEEEGGKMEEDKPADVTEETTTDSRSNQVLTAQTLVVQPAEEVEAPSVEAIQSVDRAAPSSDAAPDRPPATSDYYSDSAREEVPQPPAEDPQIAQDHPQIAQEDPQIARGRSHDARQHPKIAQDHPATVQTVAAQVSAAPPTDQPKGKKTDEPKGKKKKKRRRRRRHNQGAGPGGGAKATENEPPEVEIEYVQEDLLKPGDTHYKQFHKIFEAFKISEGSEATPKTTPTSPIPDDDTMSIAAKSSAAQKKQRDEESEDEEEPKEPAKLSKKKLRKLNRLTVAQLKQLVERPDVVEMHDVTAQDPKLLIHLKSTRNTVPVPRHWCFKRKYLQGKRGIEKPPFNLPEFIKATGIMEMRQALEDKEDEKSLKQKTRERVRPKMGKLTIDYQKLHDAFFRWQTKPRMTIHGDLYYEGKEFETRLREKKPGDLSDELRRALGMPTGMGKQKFPPPWLVAMQRYGPPPSYPNLKIPGLNAPIPEGCSFGYFVGGWGKPPVDEMGRPLYGDVFGLDNPDNVTTMNEEEIDKQLWGELESEEEMEEEEESGEEEGEMKPEDLQAGLITPLEGGLVTPSGLTSIPAGLETPEMIQLRKKKIEEAMEQGGDTPALYTVLPEKAQAVGGAVMGSSHVYDISSAVPGANKKAGGGAGEGVEVALDPSELDLDATTMTARYEEQLKETKLQKEDLSDMVAEHAAKQKKRKRVVPDSGGGKASKKLKEFKF